MPGKPFFPRKLLFKNFLVFFTFLLFAVYITYPLIFHLGSLATGTGDEYVIAWIQNWVIHAIVSNPLHLFEADIYYPYHLSLAYSDLLLPTSILAALPLWIAKQPIVTVNFTLLSSLALDGFATYLFAYSLTKNFWTSLVAGTLLTFSPAMIDKKIHLQILACEGVPLALLFFVRFLQSAKTKDLFVSLVFFVVQTYNSFLPGYFIIFAYIIFFITHFFAEKQQSMRLITKKHLFLFALSLLAIVPIMIPYYQVSLEFHYVRDIRDTIHFALQPEDFLTVGNNSRLAPVLDNIFPAKNYPANAEIKPGFIGFVFTILSLIVFFYWVLKKQKKKHWVLTACIITACLGLLLSLGPALHLNRRTIHHPFPILLPYGLLYYTVPGFQGLRNSERWEILFVFFIVIAIAILLSEVVKKYSQAQRMLMYLLLIVGIIGEYNFPMHFVPIPQLNTFPKEYAWLATTPSNTKIVEMPIFNWDMSPYNNLEVLRGYYNTMYFRTSMSGFSGFSPPPWQTLVTNLLANFPSNDSLKELRALHINYILVHTDEYDVLHTAHYKVGKKAIPDGKMVINALEKSKQVTLVKAFNQSVIFRLQ